MTNHQDDENVQLKAELEARLDAAALKVLSYTPILVRLMRSCVPAAAKCDPETLADSVSSLSGADLDGVGKATAEKCLELFGSSNLLRLPDDTAPIIFTISIDGAGEDYPQGLMNEAEDEATQVIATAVQNDEPAPRLYCLRVVLNAPMEYRHSMLRSVAKADGGLTDQCCVCLYALGDPAQLKPPGQSPGRSLLS